MMNQSNVDLVDETLREGAERSPLAPTMADLVDIGCRIAAAGVRYLSIGMFPDNPQKFELLDALLRAQADGRIGADRRFLGIVHAGAGYRRTREELRRRRLDTASILPLVIFGASDRHIQHTHWRAQLEGEGELTKAQWSALTPAERRASSAEYLDAFLAEVSREPSSAAPMVGLIDSFRADRGHLDEIVGVAQRHGVQRIRLVDTAGTAKPDETRELVAALLQAYPDVQVFGHFHDDFGLATANSLAALEAGARGVDVSLGGFANRAGHPPLAEVALALRELYGAPLPDLDYSQLTALSRRQESVFGLAERVNQPVTGVITHAVQSGIRTDLVTDDPRMFDSIVPESAGADALVCFGSRSGVDGVHRLARRFFEDHGFPGVRLDDAEAARILDRVTRRWHEHSEQTGRKVVAALRLYQDLLRRAHMSEQDVLEEIRAHVAQTRSTSDPDGAATLASF